MTDLALDFARENAFTSAHGGRSGVQDVLICITDGESQNPLYTAMAAKKVHEAMIMVLGVGVGDAVNQTELEYISTDPSRTFSVANWDALNFIMDKLRTKACEICDFWVGTNAVLIDGRCIREFPEPKTFDDAKAACEQEGTKNGVSNVRLLRLLTEEIREYAQDVVTQSGKRTWIDGNDKYVEGVWVYYDRSPANFPKSWWGQGQPDNNGNEDCLVMRFDRMLNDYSCDATLPFLCEAVVVKEGL